MDNGGADGGEQQGAAAFKKNLIINYLPQTLTDEEFTAMFSTVGAIKNCIVVRNKQTNYSYGYGFVEYVNPKDADRAIELLNGTQLQNKTIKVSFARQPGQDIKDTNLYIQNVPKEVDEARLGEMFAPYGEILQNRVLLDKQSGESRGIAFVRFSKRSEAQAAIAALDNTIPQGGTKSMRVSVAKDYNKNYGSGFGQYAAGGGGGRGDGRGRGGARGRGRGGRGAPQFAGGYNTGYDPSQAAGAYANSYAAGYAGYNSGFGDYSGAYGDYSGGYGDYGTADAVGFAAGGYGDYSAGFGAAAGAADASGWAAGRGQQRRGGRGLSKTMPKTNNRFNPMGTGF